MESEVMTFAVPGRVVSELIRMVDAGRHTDTTAEQVAALLDDPRVDVVVALWRDPDASKGIGVWVAKGLPVLEAIIERGRIATLPTGAFWLADHEDGPAIEHKA